MPLLIPVVIGREASEYSLSLLTPVLLAIAQINLEYLRAHPGTPLLYLAEVRYEERPEWLDISAALDEGYADCKTFVPWRVAELRMRGIAAVPHLERRLTGSFHARVQWPDGRLEDPSVAKGMGAEDSD